jgi:hypothetical protein
MEQRAAFFVFRQRRRWGREVVAIFAGLVVALAGRAWSHWPWLICSAAALAGYVTLRIFLQAVDAISSVQRHRGRRLT